MKKWKSFMKRFTLVVVTAVIFLFGFGFTFNTAKVHGNDEIKVAINGFLVKFDDVKPIIINGRTMVPVRGIFENLNARVRWFPEEKAVLIIKETLQIYLRINDVHVSANQDRDFILDVPATIVNGRTMVPLRFIAETLGAEVYWNEKSRTVEINIPYYPYAYTDSIGIEILSEKYKDNLEWLIGAPSEHIDLLFGEPDRIDLSRYGFDWYVYNSDLENYLMVGIKNKVVVGLFTNSMYYKLNEKVGYNTPREKVHEVFGEPLRFFSKNHKIYVLSKDEDEGETGYDMFNINDRYYTTIFYDIHNDQKVTSFMLIDYYTESLLDGYYGKPSEELRESYERQLLDLVNTVRKRHNKPLLTYDAKASDVARMHSYDMAANDYFNHTNLKGESPFDRMKRGGISFSYAGENIAAGQQCAIFAHEALMNSKKGHRDSILDDYFTHIGVGVWLDNDGSTTYTQNFYTPVKSKIPFFRF